MVSFIGGLALQVKNKNGITVWLSWTSLVGSEKWERFPRRIQSMRRQEPPP
jgi:hypothetical protein